MDTFFFWSLLNYGPKTGLNLSEDLFFWFSPNFGQENGFGFGLENFHSGLHYSQYSQIFCPPPFENPAYATAYFIPVKIASHLRHACASKWHARFPTGCRTVSNNGSGSGLAPAQNMLAVQVWFGFT